MNTNRHGSGLNNCVSAAADSLLSAERANKMRKKKLWQNDELTLCKLWLHAPDLNEFIRPSQSAAQRMTVPISALCGGLPIYRPPLSRQRLDVGTTVGRKGGKKKSRHTLPPDQKVLNILKKKKKKTPTASVLELKPPPPKNS